MRVILSSLLPKPPTPLTPPTGEHKPVLHGIYGPADGDTASILTNIVLSLGPLAQPSAVPTPDPAVNITAISTLTDAQRMSSGSLTLVRQDDASVLSFEQYTLYWAGEKIERGWVSKSTIPILHSLGSIVVVTTPESPALTHSCTIGMTNAIDNTIVQLRDAQKRLSAVHESMNRNISAIETLTSENNRLRKLLDARPRGNVDEHIDLPSEPIASDDPWGWMNKAHDGSMDVVQPAHISDLDQVILAARNDALAEGLHCPQLPRVIEPKHERTYEDIQQATVLDAQHQVAIDERIATIWVENLQNGNTIENYECGIRDPREPQDPSSTPNDTSEDTLFKHLTLSREHRPRPIRSTYRRANREEDTVAQQ